MSEPEPPEADLPPLDIIDDRPQFVVVWRNADTPARAVSTHLYHGKVITFEASDEVVLKAKMVDLAEEAGELLEHGNGRKIAMPLEAARVVFTDKEFVAASSLA